MGVVDGTSINIKPSGMHVEGGDEKERQYKRRRGQWDKGIEKIKQETL